MTFHSHTWNHRRWRTSLLVTPQGSWEMHLGLAGLLHSLEHFESNAPIQIPHHSLPINNQGLHDLLDHRKVSPMHKCSVLTALITGRVCWMQNLPVTLSKTTTKHRLSREGEEGKSRDRATSRGWEDVWAHLLGQPGSTGQSHWQPCEGSTVPSDCREELASV